MSNAGNYGEFKDMVAEKEKNEFPLYPELPEDGKNQAQNLVNLFKGELIKAAEEAIGTLYCDVAMHIESDSWGNYRNQLMDGLRNYHHRSIQGEHDFKMIRKAIYEEFREEIIVDLNQDLVEENEGLKNHIAYLESYQA